MPCYLKPLCSPNLPKASPCTPLRSLLYSMTWLPLQISLLKWNVLLSQCVDLLCRLYFEGSSLFFAGSVLYIPRLYGDLCHPQSACATCLSM